ncbi:hypothetical protein X798_05829, partial [Onchocerca flexuosa]
MNTLVAVVTINQLSTNDPTGIPIIEMHELNVSNINRENIQASKVLLQPNKQKVAKLYCDIE